MSMVVNNQLKVGRPRPAALGSGSSPPVAPALSPLAPCPDAQAKQIIHLTELPMEPIRHVCLDSSGESAEAGPALCPRREGTGLGAPRPASAAQHPNLCP